MPTDELRTKRLTVADREVARLLFILMGEVFEEAPEPLSDTYLERLLSREDFWVIAAFVGDAIIGGVTAHTLPMTRAESAELFIYDIAVHADHQRRGVGRHLMTALRQAATAARINVLFVLADNEDAHALDFYRVLGGVASPVTAFTFSEEEP
jgi:aminoglycoside 3-N-acetyltransferase I